MLIASAIPKVAGGRRMLVLGLMAGNVKQLLNDKPILKNLDDEGVPGLEGWDITILGPEDTARFVAHYGLEMPDGS